MCGIAGYVGQGDRELLQRMGNAIKHRGPDGEGYWSGDAVGLGHRRLAIIDLAGGHQPMSNEDDSIWIVFNGEIYNYQDLRKELEGCGHRFQTQSDTEVIVHAYEEYGRNCAGRLRGMFAFAIWDTKTNTLFCARDRLGIKPFFYTETPHGLLFASEIKALLVDPRIRPSINLSAFHEYMSFGFVPGPETIYEGIQHLPPGCTLLFRGGQTEINTYWRMEEIDYIDDSFEHARDHLSKLLLDSVEMRLLADVPVGAYVSGGLDSGLVASLMQQARGAQVATFSVGFAEQSRDETPFSNIVAEWLGTDHYNLRSEGSSLQLLPTVAYHVDQPLNDAATIPTYEMARLTKQHVTVVQTGEGADECFSGYEHMKFVRYLLDPSWGLPLRTFGRFLAPVAALSPRRRRIMELLSRCRSPFDMMDVVFGRFSLRQKKSLYGPRMLEGLEQFEQHHAALLHERLGSGPPYQQIVNFYLQTYLPDDLLVKVDRTTMAHGVEARVPYLDHRVVEFARSIPPHWKVARWTEKFLLRSIAKRHLPRAIWSRAKQGFGVPFERWLRLGANSHPWRTQVREQLAASGIINPSSWSNWLEADKMPERDETQRHTLLFFEEWLRSFGDCLSW